MSAADITVERILEAYEQTGLIPRAGSVYIPAGDYGSGYHPPMGCALGALGLAAGLERPTPDAAQRALGLTASEVSVLAAGFDAAMTGYPIRPDMEGLYLASVGFRAGAIIRGRARVGA